MRWPAACSRTHSAECVPAGVSTHETDPVPPRISQVLLSCLAHLKSGDLATACDDTDPTFLRNFYGLSRAFAEELFFSKSSERARPIQGATGPEVMAEVCRQLDRQLRGKSLPEKEACVKDYLKL